MINDFWFPTLGEFSAGCQWPSHINQSPFIRFIGNLHTQVLLTNHKNWLHHMTSWGIPSITQNACVWLQLGKWNGFRFLPDCGLHNIRKRICFTQCRVQNWKWEIYHISWWWYITTGTSCSDVIITIRTAQYLKCNVFVMRFYFEPEWCILQQTPQHFFSWFSPLCTWCLTE